jgi:hypothetical protein
VYTLLCISISGINDSKLISNPIHAPNHELEDTAIKIPVINVVDKRIFVELLGMQRREDLLYLWGMNPLAYLSLLFHCDTFWCIVHKNF